MLEFVDGDVQAGFYHWLVRHADVELAVDVEVVLDVVVDVLAGDMSCFEIVGSRRCVFVHRAIGERHLFTDIQSPAVFFPDIGVSIFGQMMRMKPRVARYGTIAIGFFGERNEIRKIPVAGEITVVDDDRG